MVCFVLAWTLLVLGVYHLELLQLLTQVSYLLRAVGTLSQMVLLLEVPLGVLSLLGTRPHLALGLCSDILAAGVLGFRFIYFRKCACWVFLG